jgi:hypothetical protein
MMWHALRWHMAVLERLPLTKTAVHMSSPKLMMG